MTQNRPGGREPARAEQPSPAARLTITVRPLGTAEGTVPAREARYLITTFGVLGSVVSGTAGAVLTLRIGPGLTTLALAELLLALTAVVVIAACSRMRKRDRQDTKQQKTP
jgi:hypothetical protein